MNPIWICRFISRSCPERPRVQRADFSAKGCNCARARSLASFPLQPCPRRMSLTMSKSRKQTKITPAERAKLNAAREYIIASFERNPSFTEVANHVGLSPFHFHRRYSLCFGETPKGLVDRMRIDKAKQL